MSKTILITGATDGIGLETTKLLAAQGHRLLLHGRNEEKLGRTQAMLREIDGAPSVTAMLMRRASWRSPCGPSIWRNNWVAMVLSSSRSILRHSLPAKW